MPRLKPVAGLRLLVLAVLLTLLVSTPAGAPAQAASKVVLETALLDSYATYEPQRDCTGTPQPGTAELGRFITTTWPQYQSIGMLRSCGAGGTSEHKDGRALDWGVDVSVPAQRRAGYELIETLLASDELGNPHALARRVGVMYVIYDDTIWSAYRGFAPRRYLNAGCTKLKRCSRTLRHRDHVHVSLSRAGGAAQTSWYLSRGVTPKPVLLDGTKQLNYDATAVHHVEVPTDGRKVAVRGFKLAADTTYRVVVSGQTSTGIPGQVADASCTRDANGPWVTRAPTTPVPTPEPAPDHQPTRGRGWGGWGSGSRTAGSLMPPSVPRAPVPGTSALLINGQVRFSEVCDADQTYEAWVRFGHPQKLRAQFLTAKAGAGSFTLWIARDDIPRQALVRR